MNKARLLVIGGTLALIIGGFLPWISVPHLYGLSGPAYEGIAIGWEGDGTLTAGVGVILLLSELLLRRGSQRWFALVGGILALLAASVVLLDFRQIVALDPAAGFYAATDYGIYVTLAGALLALGGCLLKRIPGSAQRVVTAVSTLLWR